MDNTKKVIYPLFYRIPWPENQNLEPAMDEDPEGTEETIHFTGYDEAFVEKEWFDENRDKYGL